MSRPNQAMVGGISMADLTAEQRQLYDALRRGPRWPAGTDRARPEPGTPLGPPHGKEPQADPGDHGSAEARWPLPGPFGPMLLSPVVGMALQELGVALRFRGSLPESLRELATVAVATACGSGYELERHLPLARRAGVDEETLAWVAHTVAGSVAGRSDGTPGPSDGATFDGVGGSGAVDDLARAVVHAVQFLTGEGDGGFAARSAGAEAMESVHDLLGSAATFELVVLVGYYRLLATVLSVYGIDEPRIEAAALVGEGQTPPPIEGNGDIE